MTQNIEDLSDCMCKDRKAIFLKLKKELNLDGTLEEIAANTFIRSEITSNNLLNNSICYNGELADGGVSFSLHYKDKKKYEKVSIIVKTPSREIVVPITEDLVMRFVSGIEKHLNWPGISSLKFLSENFLRKYKNKIIWKLVEYSNLSEDFISEHANYVDWYHVSHLESLSEDFIRKNKNKVNWTFISTIKKLSEEFIEEFKNKVDWYNICACQNLSGGFIRKFEHLVDWDCICVCQNLSEDFISEYQSKLCWDDICKYQVLSEGFIEKYKTKVNWQLISKHQYLSKKFAKKFIKSIYLDLLGINEKIDWNVGSLWKK